MKIKEFLESDKPGKLKFFGSETADLFSKEIAASFEAVLRKNYITEDEQFMPGFITASVDGRPWYNTMWTRDVGTFIRELVLWGHLNHACLASDCLIKLVEQNEEGYFTFPEYFKYATPASGDELDGTASIIIGMTLLWQRLADDNPYKEKIYHFLNQPRSPLHYIHRKLKSQPLLAGSGEFGGGCGIEGKYYNVVHNNLIRLALLAAAKMETKAGNSETAEFYERDAEKIRQNMEKYLLNDDGAWIWCIRPDTLKPDDEVINHPINKGFGGLNGVASMYADVSGLELLASDWSGASACKKTFDKLLSFPLRSEQFDKYGIWTQFDEFREGLFTGPSYGHGYALQTMLLYDEMELAQKALTYLANATYKPPPEYHELDRQSRYYFYERYYSPDCVGKMTLEQGCGALNLVNVAEPLKIARLISGVDDFSSEKVKIIPRIPPSWRGYEAVGWPIRSENGLARANIKFEKKEGNIHFKLDMKFGAEIRSLAMRIPTKKGVVWYKRRNISQVELII